VEPCYLVCLLHVEVESLLKSLPTFPTSLTATCQRRYSLITGNKTRSFHAPFRAGRASGVPEEKKVLIYCFSRVFERKESAYFRGGHRSRFQNQIRSRPSANASRSDQIKTGHERRQIRSNQIKSDHDRIHNQIRSKSDQG